MKLVPAGLLLLSLLPASSAAQGRGASSTKKQSTTRAETYESAFIDANGSLRITTSDHREIVVSKGELDGFGKQTSFTEPQISSNRTAVGSQAEYKNCCTSYDIPLQLVVYSQGRVHRFRGIHLALFRWHFADAGTRVAYSQETVHFSCETHYELREIRSERLIDSADVPQLCAQVPDPVTVKVPRWVTDLLDAPREQ